MVPRRRPSTGYASSWPSVSECFVVAMWWALIVWDEQPGPMPAAFFALFGAATFLTWPVWIGPPLVVLAICLGFRRDLRSVDRVKQFGLAVAPICAAAALHSADRTRSFGIVAVAGFVLQYAAVSIATYSLA